MDLAFLLVLPALLWIQSWYLLGFYANPRTLGQIAAAVAIVLFGIVVFQDNLALAIKAPTELGLGSWIKPSTAFSVFVLVWAIYAVMVSGVYLWGFDTRTLGLYSLFLWVVSALFAVYFFIGDRLLADGEILQYTWMMGVVAVLLAVLSALLFFYLSLRSPGQGEPASSPMRTVTGWFYLVFSIAVTVLGGLLLLGLDPLLPQPTASSTFLP